MEVGRTIYSLEEGPDRDWAVSDGLGWPLALRLWRCSIRLSFLKMLSMITFKCWCPKQYEKIWPDEDNFTACPLSLNTEHWNCAPVDQWTWRNSVGSKLGIFRRKKESAVSRPLSTNRKALSLEEPLLHLWNGTWGSPIALKFRIEGHSYLRALDLCCPWLCLTCTIRLHWQRLSS